jgi:hypothetical protein
MKQELKEQDQKADLNEAPKKIWIDAEFDVYTYYYDGDIPYIRADLVDGLVEALKICLAGNGYEFDDRPAEAALKALEAE